MWFAVPELTRHHHCIEKRRHAKLVDDAEGRWRMCQIGQETEAVFSLEGGKHFYCSRDRRSVIDKRAKIRLDRQGNTWIIGLNVVSQLLQGGADPEAIVRLFTVALCRLHKPSGGGAVDREKGLVCNGHTTALQAPHQAPHGFFTTQVVHRNEGLKQVKTNGRNMLHEVRPSPPQMFASTPWRVEYLAASSASTVSAATFPLSRGEEAWNTCCLSRSTCIHCVHYRTRR